jgi:hypothetical protein
MRADAGAGEEGRNARTARAQLLGQRALGREFQLQLAGQVLALELLVLTDIAGNHLLDLPRLQQLAQAEVVDAGVVGYGSGILTPLSRSASIKASGMPHKPKPPTAINCPSWTMPSSAAAALG